MCLLAPGVELLLTDAPDVWCVPCGCAGSLAGRVVIALIQAEILDHPLGVGALDHDRVDGSGQELGVVDVGAVDRYPQRAASLLDDYALLGAHLGPVGGVWASRATLEAALAHHTVGGLPLPADRPQRLTLDDQGGPDLHRNGEQGSPRVSGATSRSSSCSIPGWVSSIGFLPAPRRRTRPSSSTSPDSNSRTPRRQSPR